MSVAIVVGILLTLPEIIVLAFQETPFGLERSIADSGSAQAMEQAQQPNLGPQV